MRLLLLFGIALLICLAIQTTAPLWLPVRALLPNLVVILAVDLGLRHHGVLPAAMAFAMGYAVDVFSGTHIGLNALFMTLVYLLTYEVSSRLMMTNAIVGAVAVFLGAMVTGASQAGIGLATGASGELQAMIPALVVQAAVSAALAPAVFSILARLKNAIGLRAKAERE